MKLKRIIIIISVLFILNIFNVNALQECNYVPNMGVRTTPAGGGSDNWVYNYCSGSTLYEYSCINNNGETEYCYGENTGCRYGIKDSYSCGKSCSGRTCTRTCYAANCFNGQPNEGEQTLSLGWSGGTWGSCDASGCSSCNLNYRSSGGNCVLCDANEIIGVTCNDGENNDCDTYTDGADPDCVVCNPSNACAANTCTEQTCADNCGNVYSGTKNCACSSNCARGESCTSDVMCASNNCNPDHCCPTNYEWVGGECRAAQVDPCNVNSCGSRICGADPDGCGSCGGCPSGQSCSNGDCIVIPPDSCNVNSCGSRECGADPDGCGSCGSCSSGQSCNSNGQCDIIPLGPCDENGCGSRICGADPDGCGNCGTCPSGQSCDASGQCYSVNLCVGVTCPDWCKQWSTRLYDNGWCRPSDGACVYDRNDCSPTCGAGACAYGTCIGSTCTDACGTHSGKLVCSCDITSVSWNQVSASETANVGITVTGNTACNGKTVTFTVNEYDSTGNDPVQTQPSSKVFSGQATTIWKAEWQYDGDGNGEPPEYIVTATVAGDDSMQSSNQLQVFKWTCSFEDQQPSLKGELCCAGLWDSSDHCCQNEYHWNGNDCVIASQCTPPNSPGSCLGLEVCCDVNYGIATKDCLTIDEIIAPSLS